MQHRRLTLSNDLAHDQNPAAAVGTGIASSATVRAEKRAVDQRIFVDDDWRRVGHVSAPMQRPIFGADELQPLLGRRIEQRCLADVERKTHLAG
jgi:hypothetical protein